VGADLSNDHPVGNNTIVHPGTTGFQTTITLGGVEVTDGTEMACTTCHSVHNDTGSGVKLLKATTATDFCVACHNK